jgi:hypothetical protein
MQQHDPEALAVGLLSVSRALVDGVSAGVRARGFGDVRPAHGFAFARLAPDGATITNSLNISTSPGRPRPSWWTSSWPRATCSAAPTRTTRGPA